MANVTYRPQSAHPRPPLVLDGELLRALRSAGDQRDPTQLTTEQTDRAIAAVREIFGAQLEGQQAVFETRLAGMDEAIKLLQTILDRVPSQMDTKVQHLGEVNSETFKVVYEKFEGVEKQFIERDVRVREAAATTTTAVNAALQAAKEAVGEQNKSFSLSIDKSEKATLEQINQQRLLLESTTKGLSDNIVDLKERLTRAEGQAAAAATALATALASTNQTQTEKQGSTSNLAAVASIVIGGLIGVGGLVLAIVK